MYSLSARVNSIFFFTAFTLTVLCGLNILTSKVAQVRETNVEFKVNKLIRFFENPRMGWDEVHFDFNLHTDLTKLYNWNVKQLFLYATFSFNEDIKGKRSEVTFYDQIIPREIGSIRPYTINLEQKRFEYALRDVYKSLKGQEVKVNVYCEIMPIVGYIERIKISSHTYQLPNEYVKSS